MTDRLSPARPDGRVPGRPGAPASSLALVPAFAAIYLIWGSTYLGMRLVVEAIPPFLAAGARFLLAGLILALWLACTRRLRATRRQWRDGLISGALLLLGGNGVVMWAEQKIPSGITTLIISCSPLFMVLINWLAPRGSRPSGATFFGLALGLGGLLLLIGGPAGGAPPDPASCAGLLLGCLSWSLGSLYSHHARQPAEPLTAATLQMLCGGPLMLLAGIAGGELRALHLAAVPLRSALAWGYLVGAGSLVAFPCYAWLLKHSTPARVSTYAYVNPVVAVFLGWLLLGEPVTPRTLLAAAVIVAAVAVITLQRARAEARA